MFFSPSFTTSSSSSRSVQPQVFYFGSLSPGWTQFASNSNNFQNSDPSNGHFHQHYYSSRGQNLVPIMFDASDLRSATGGDPLSDLEAQILRHFFLQHRAMALAEEPNAQVTATANRSFQQHQRNPNRTIPQATNRKLISRLPIFVCDSNDPYQKEFGDAQKECSICLSESEDGEKLVVLPCQHSFHPNCIKPWLKEHNSCPTCRFELEMADQEQDKQRIVRMSEKYGRKALELMSFYIQIQFMYSELQKWTLAMKASSSNQRSRRKRRQTMSDTSSVEEKINLSKTSRKIQDLPKRKSHMISLLNSREKKLNEISKQISLITIEANQCSDSNSTRNEQSTSASSTQQQHYAWDNNLLNHLRDQCSHRIMIIQGMIDTLREIINDSKKGCCAIC